MAYQLRDRKQKAVYIDPDYSASSQSESENDPDYYSTRSSLRRPRSKRGVMVNGSPAIAIQAKQADLAPNSEPVVKRRPGRPRKNPAPAGLEQIGKVPKRERGRRSSAPYVVTRRSNSAAKNSQGKSVDRITILALLIKLEILEEKEQVYCWDDTTETLGLPGKVTKSGIICACCDKLVTVSEFLGHSGIENTTYPHSKVVVAKNLYTLLGCEALGWLKFFKLNKWSFSNEYINHYENDPSDDACLVCADGGDLICCEKCPLTFHPKCLEMETVPGSIWVCPCCLCTHCGQPASNRKNVRQCRLCEHSYHLSCCDHLSEGATVDSSDFCSDTCIELDKKLKGWVGLKHNLGEGFSWTILRHTVRIGQKDLFKKFYGMIENNSKIALAWILMKQCFNPIVDRLTKIDVLRTVIYNNWSKFTRINFNGFYTIVLEKDDELIAAASLRLRGKEIAEMPFVGTNWNYRKKGMLKMLMAGIGSALSYLEVEKLVIPSAEDVQDMWINKFGFSRIESSMEKRIALSKTLMFPTSTRLMKPGIMNNKQAQDDNERAEETVVDKKPKTLLPFDLNLTPPMEDEEMTLDA